MAEPKDPKVEPEKGEAGTAGKAGGPKARRKKAEPKAAAKPKAEAKPKAPRKKGEPKTEVEPKAAAKPKAEAKPKTEAKPKAEAQPKAEAATPAKPRARARRGAHEPGTTAPVVRAQAKYVRTSARKARLVCDHIRGKSVSEARAIIAFTPRAVASDWAKLLNSAVANAENNHELLGDDLRVATAFADEGPTLKRFRPRAMGRATKILKRTSHLTITLTPKEPTR